jgi:multidrug efflux pump subunit AcrA (membrane-fusion protein)
MKSKFFSTTFLLIPLALLATACGSPSRATPEPAATLPPVTTSSGIIAEGRVEPVRYTELALNAGGLVSEVLAHEGDEVTAGQVIARIENSQAQTLEAAQANAAQALTLAYQEVRDAQSKLDDFDVPSEFAGQTPSQAVAATLEKLNAARANFEPYKSLSEKRLTLNGKETEGVYRDVAKRYKKELDDAWAKYRRAIQWLELESDLESAQARLALAQKDYAALEDPSFAEDTAGVRAALANAEVRSPFPGTITDLALKVGEFAASGEKVVTIADLGGWVVKTTDLTEIDVVELKEGQPVTVTLDAIPGVTLKGNVLSIGQGFSEKQGDIVYEVTVLLTEGQPAMRWGMTAEVKFEQ